MAKKTLPRLQISCNYLLTISATKTDFFCKNLACWLFILKKMNTILIAQLARRFDCSLISTGETLKKSLKIQLTQFLFRAQFHF